MNTSKRHVRDFFERKWSSKDLGKSVFDGCKNYEDYVNRVLPMRKTSRQRKFIKEYRDTIQKLASRMYNDCGRGIVIIDIIRGQEEFYYIQESDFSNASNNQSWLNMLKNYDPNKECILVFQALTVDLPLEKCWIVNIDPLSHDGTTRHF